MEKEGFLYSFFLDNWKNNMFRANSVNTKVAAFAFLFFQAVLGYTSMVAGNNLNFVFGLLVFKHALVGFYTFFKENANKYISLFHSYFSFALLGAFMCVLDRKSVV